MSTDITLLASKKNALLLGAFATACTLMVSLTYVLTKPVIERQEKRQTFAKVTQVLKVNGFDNNPLDNCVYLQDANISGVDAPLPVYRATKSGEPYALIYQTQTKQGYNGQIKLIAAVDNKGKVQGVRALTHQETPGLGDKIELEKDDWILSFNDKQVKGIEDPHWFVKKDGGDFDQFTGATITPRAVVNQLRTSLVHINEQFDEIFSLPNACQVPQAQNEVPNDN